MKIFCVCIEEYIDDGDVYRVEMFSTLENATLYLNDITSADIKGDIVEYTLDEPESGDTCFIIDDDDYTESESGDYSDDE